MPTTAPPDFLSNLSLHVSDVETSLAFYRDGLGLPILLDTGWTSDPARLAVAGLPLTASLRSVTVEIPGTAPNMSLIEFRDIEREIVPQPAFQDAGGVHFAFRVTDMAKSLAAVAEVAAIEPLGTPLEILGADGVVKIVFFRDPDGFVVELIEKAA